MQAPKTASEEDQERLKWARNNVPLKDLFRYFYSGPSGSLNKSLDELREYIDAKRGHG